MGVPAQMSPPPEKSPNRESSQTDPRSRRNEASRSAPTSRPSWPEAAAVSSTAVSSTGVSSTGVSSTAAAALAGAALAAAVVRAAKRGLGTQMSYTFERGDMTCGERTDATHSSKSKAAKYAKKAQRRAPIVCAIGCGASPLCRQVAASCEPFAFHALLATACHIREDACTHGDRLQSINQSINQPINPCTSGPACKPKHDSTNRKTQLIARLN